MSDTVLLVTRLLLLALLYLFLWQVTRVMAADLRGRERPRRSTPQRPVTASTVPRPRRRPPRELIVHQPDGAVHRITLGTSAVRLGRTGEPPLTDDFVSDEHVEFAPSEDGWTVRDLGSTNGTYIGGGKVVGNVPVATGDDVRIGKTRIEVRR